MQFVCIATWAIFLPLDALRVQPLVLHGEVIAVFALGATEDDFLARHIKQSPESLSVPFQEVTGHPRLRGKGFYRVPVERLMWARGAQLETARGSPET